MKRILLLFLAPLALFGQLETGGLTAKSGSAIDFGAATFEVQNGTAAPLTTDCDSDAEKGRLYLKTDATSGQQLYACEGLANGWVLQGDGGVATAYTSGTSLPGTCTEGELYFKTDADDGKQLHKCIATNRWVVDSGAFAVFNVHDFGAAGDGVADDTAEIQAAIDAAEATGHSGSNGAIVYFPPGRYMISDPLVLPRSGSTPDGFVHLKGAGVRLATIRGTGAWDSGEALIQWEAVDERAWYNKISDLQLWPPNVDGTMAIRYLPTDKASEASTFGEYLVIELENILIQCENQYHEVAIQLEGNVRNSSFRHIELDPALTSRVYDTLLFRFDEAVADDAPGWGDLRGVNYSTFEHIYATVRRGGYSRVFEGRFGGVTVNNTFCNGSYENTNVCYNFIESVNSVFTTLQNEGYGETQVVLEDCENMTFFDLGLATPNDAGGGVNDGLELIDSSRNLFIGRPSRAGQPSFNASGVKAIVLDADSDENTFLNWQLADEFANEVTDGGDDNYFELFIRDVTSEEVVGLHPYHRSPPGNVATTGLTAAVSTTNLVASATAGLYRVNGYMHTTTAAAGVCTSDVTIGWTYNSAAKTEEVVTDHDQNTDEQYSQIPPTIVRVDASTNLTYAISLDAGGDCSNAVYDAYLTAERLQ